MSGMTAALPRKQSSYEMQYVEGVLSFIGNFSDFADCKNSMTLALMYYNVQTKTKPQECFREIWEAAEKLYGDLIPLSQNIFRQIKTSSVPKEYIENYLQTVWKTFLENFFYKLFQHRNNAMRLRALILRFRSPIRQFDSHLVRIYRRLKRATQLLRLMLLHCAQTIIN
ncbi:hypothetical protein T01_13671 [Trichinella spiralis]|uniref:Uncharacterized protein n=1 Tax=Trichinella spiralis TaxID=6334 RepID=A0A0V1B9G8_TRISP|nr:hypothetical protein T01_13671 [Trichinella spiralis]